MNTMLSTGAQVTFDDAIERVKGEFLEMPGMRLTLAQATRLWQFDREFSEAVLSALVSTRFLVRSPGPTFARAS